MITLHSSAVLLMTDERVLCVVTGVVRGDGRRAAASTRTPEVVLREHPRVAVEIPRSSSDQGGSPWK